MKSKLLPVAVMLLFASCYSVKKTVEKSEPNVSKINWPKEYNPKSSKFFVYNEIEINASPEKVWNVLINAGEWEQYYVGANDIKLLGNTSGKLDKTSVFTWNTMGLDFTSTIKEFEPPYKLSWESKRKNIRGYHTWLIMPTKKGSKLITSEAQKGFMTFPQKIFVPNKLRKLHDIWLEQIKLKSENLEK